MKNSELISLKKGAFFEHEGKKYRTAEDGLRYKKNCKKKCIVPPTGESQQAVIIDTAVSKKWIQPETKTMAETHDMLRLDLEDAVALPDQEPLPSKQFVPQRITEPDHQVTDAEEKNPDTTDATENGLTSDPSIEEPSLSDHTEEPKAPDDQSRCPPEDSSTVSAESPPVNLDKGPLRSKKGDAQGVDKSEFTSSTESFFYILVDSIRARTFLVRGLIYPAIYDEDELDKQYQDHHQPGSLRLTSDRPQLNSKNQVILKVLLLDDEIQTLENSGFMFDRPLPISRLCQIEISPAAGGPERFVKGWVNPDVPAPPLDLFCEASEPSDLTDNTIVPQTEDIGAKPKEEIKDAIKRFDRALGAVAFWRNADRYVSGVSGYYSDYPEGFETVFDLIIDSADSANSDESFLTCFFLYILGIKTQNSRPTSNCILDDLLLTASHIDRKYARECAACLYEKLDRNEALRDAFKKLFEGDYRTAIRLLQKPNIPIETAVLAALFKYSARKSNDHQIIKAVIHEDIPNHEHRRAVLAVLGAYHGYAAINACEETLPSIHPDISDKIEARPDIKFHLKNRFERILIEALYRRSFGFFDYADVPLDSLYVSFFPPSENSTKTEELEESDLVVRSELYRNELLVRTYQAEMGLKAVRVFYDERPEGYAYYEFRVKFPKKLFHDLAESKVSKAFNEMLQIVQTIWGQMERQIFDRQSKGDRK